MCWDYGGELTPSESPWDPSLPHFVRVSFKAAISEELSCPALVGKNYNLYSHG